ncbi:glycosyltransferase involved in cell wall biosynthesis [Pedobacter psychrotolerans]|uniref:Alpha-L-Rha alpha-1,3-L-rhamnosyltransferase n=1 Tax=Pedobacter psychrotolerans TaxID=1843235 RepID=A0A4R2HEC5_9SPHI|nr:glycosyltransferase family 2 protein [Pedobacter psychrotolerans]TCO26679.1 glycosyltransferase involved in cell wall biosynthesis [Pedobacter psychrotolerans]GGE55676.1 alpha-L-Rha alpha-1,3-L-rhamnosyltransferase [Pedobacter psychrotolerans]
MDIKSERMISVCLATYNGSHFIKRQLESVLPQLSSEDEIIISDDSSVDDTIDIIKTFNDNRIKIFTGNNFRNPALNFGFAMEQAKGDIVFLCDQDDIWFDTKIKDHLEVHEKYDLVISDAIVVDPELQIIYPSFFSARNSKSGILHNLLKNRYIGCCMSFNRKTLGHALPFPDGLHMHDWWIGLVAELKGEVYFLNKPLMYYIRHSNNASGTLTVTLPLKDQIKNRMHLIYNLIKLK